MKTVKIGMKLVKFMLMAGGVLFHAPSSPTIPGRLHRDGPEVSHSGVEIKRGNMENTVSCTGTLAAVGTVEGGDPGVRYNQKGAGGL